MSAAPARAPATPTRCVARDPLVQQHGRERDRHDRVEGGEDGDDAEEAARRREAEEHVRPDVAEADDDQRGQVGRARAEGRRRGRGGADREDRRDAARGRDGPRHALLGGAVEEDEVEPEAERGHEREPDSRRRGRRRDAPARARRARRPRARARSRPPAGRPGRSPEAIPTVNGIAADGAEIGATIPIAPDGHAAVEGPEPEAAADARRAAHAASTSPGTRRRRRRPTRAPPAKPTTCESAEHGEHVQRARLEPAEKSPTPHETLAPSASAIASHSRPGLVAATASSWFAW